MSNTWQQIIKNRMKDIGETQESLAEKLSVSQGSIAHWLSGRRKPDTEIISMLMKSVGLNNLVLKNDGSAGLLNNFDKNVVPANIGSRKVPIISYVQAGIWAGIDDLKDSTGDYQYVLTDNDISEDAFALNVRGESMLPEFKEGDIIIIDPHEEPTAGEFVVAVNGDHEATFKKYCEDGVDQYGRHHFILVALNPDFKHQMSSREQEIRIIGSMVEHRIFRRKR